MTTPIIPGLSHLADQFDALILDLWGVVHDGVTAYAGVQDTLARIRAAGKKTLMLSNAPRRAQALIDQLSGFGIERGWYDQVLSSGEAVHDALKDRTDPFFAALGRNLYHLGPVRDRNVFAGLDYLPVDLDQADFIFNSGPVEVTECLADYRDLLARAKARDLPMICANPDRQVMREGRPIMCAGELALAYADMGGRVVTRGKPDPAIYADALAKLGCDKSRVLAVGDGLHTDIKGANGAGIGAVLVTQGIHCGELNIAPGETPDPTLLNSVIQRHGETPLAAMATFRW